MGRVKIFPPKREEQVLRTGVKGCSKILRVLAKSRLILDEMCRLYGKFASYVRRVLFFLLQMALITLSEDSDIDVDGIEGAIWISGRLRSIN